MQHTVDAVLDGNFLVARFDVDITGAPFERVEDGGIDQLDHRSDIVIGRRELVDGERFFRIFIASNNVQRETFGHFLQHALRLFGLFE